MSELDQMNPEMGQDSAAAGLPNGATDREGAMAKADLYKLANYSHKLFQQIQDDTQMEAWVQAKITKAADYIASVYHYMEYEMKFSAYGKALDNSDVLSERQRNVLNNRLMEAKAKMKDLKKAQAEKIKEARIIGGGKEEACAECGGTGVVMSQGKVVPAHVHGKVEKYKRLTKATHAAHKRLDANHNGIPDEDEFEEGFDDKSKVGDEFKTRTGVAKKTDTGVTHTNTSYHDDGDEIASNAKSGKGIKSHAKAQSAAEKKAQAPKQKPSPKSEKTWGMKDGEKFDNRDGAEKPAKKKKEQEVDETYGQGVYEAKGKKPDFLDMDKDGNKKEPMKKAVADKKAGPKKGVNPFAKKGAAPKKGVNPFAKKMDEAAKKCCCEEKGKTKCPVHSKVVEATMSKAAKGNEKYGKDGMKALAKAGKEGKSLDPVRAKYDKYDESSAAAAMWKNIKETTGYIAEKAKIAPTKDDPKAGKEGNAFGLAATQTEKGEHIKVKGKDTGLVKKESIAESVDFARMKQLMARLNG